MLLIPMSDHPATRGSFEDLIGWLQWLIQLDSITGAQKTIGTVHAEIHEGDHYTTSVVDPDVDIIAPKYVRITTPDTAARIHLTATVTGSGGFIAELYENATVSVAGSALAELNNDRNSGNTAVATLFEDDTIGADGTLLQIGRGGSTRGVRIAGESNTRREWILKQNEDYVIKVTAVGDNTEIEVVVTWYEE